MEKYVSFLGSLLYDMHINDDHIEDNIRQRLIKQKEDFCSFALSLDVV